MSGLNMALSSLGSLSLRDKIRNDDGIDQLHHFFTVAVLTLFAAVVGFLEFVVDPINCWNSGDYQWKHYQDHVNMYCWTHPMYRYPDAENHSVVPYTLDAQGQAENGTLQNVAAETRSLHFVRWASVFFLLQALLFKLPNLLWSEVNASQGSNMVKMVEMLQTVVLTTGEEKNREQTLKPMALFVEKWLSIHRKPRWLLDSSQVSPLVKKTLSCCMVCVGNNLNNFLSTLYLVVKLLFLLNVLLQFLLLSLFLDLNFWTFGVRTLESYDSAGDLFRVGEDTGGGGGGSFPVLALCHFETFENQASMGYWVQCILTINIFLEKLFLIEWFWLLILLVLTIVNFITWCVRILQTQTALNFVKRYMKLMYAYSEPVETPASCSVEQFVTEYLRNDGIFVLRILSVNTNEVVVAQLVEELWRRYLAFQDLTGTSGSSSGPAGGKPPMKDE